MTLLQTHIEMYNFKYTNILNVQTAEAWGLLYNWNGKGLKMTPPNSARDRIK